MATRLFSKASRVCSFCNEPCRILTPQGYCESCNCVMGHADGRKDSCACKRQAPPPLGAKDIASGEREPLASDNGLSPTQRYRLLRSQTACRQETTYEQACRSAPTGPDHRLLWQRIQSCSKLWAAGAGEWKGTARELYARLMLASSAEEVRGFAKTPLHLALCLRALRKLFPEYCTYVFRPGVVTTFTIVRHAE